MHIIPRYIDILAEMLSALEKEDPGAWSDYPCLEWPFPRNRSGHAIVIANGKFIAVHRFAWSSVNGDIPAGLDVRHQCDNPPCFRPSHLVVGTHLQNMRDRDIRGRRKYKLSPEKAEEIRRLCRAGVVQNEIARQFSVTPVIISAIKHGKIWQTYKHAIDPVTC